LNGPLAKNKPSKGFQILIGGFNSDNFWKYFAIAVSRNCWGAFPVIYLLIVDGLPYGRKPYIATIKKHTAIDMSRLLIQIFYLPLSHGKYRKECNRSAALLVNGLAF
jgi:hypothetical protein